MLELNLAKDFEKPNLGHTQHTKRSKTFDSKTSDFIIQKFATWLDVEIQEHLASRAGDTPPTLRFFDEKMLTLTISPS